MTSTVPFIIAAFSCCLAIAVLLRRRSSIARWFFAIGLLLLAADTVFGALAMRSSDAERIDFWQTLALIVKSALPALWLCFSLTYSRGNHREFLVRWRFVLAAAFLLPVCIIFFARDDLIEVFQPADAGGEWWLAFTAPAKVLNALLLVAIVAILANLEKTFRSAVGTMQWRIKFVVLGLAVIFGARLYSLSQALLFTGQSLNLVSVDAGGLAIGSVLMCVAFIRRGFGEIDVYPSHAVLQSSVTVLLAGGYLLIVGVLAHLVSYLGGAASLQFQAFLVLTAIAILAILLLSDRVRDRIRRFVSRHFKRPEHDFRNVWTNFTVRTASVLDQAGVCAVTTKLISETFNVLSVTMCMIDERRDRMVLGISTSRTERGIDGELMPSKGVVAAAIAELRERRRPFDLDETGGDWADALKKISPVQFDNGGHRFCVPLFSGERCLGLLVLGDRVSGIRYTVEEFELLKCIGDHIAMCLLNLRLTDELINARQLEAFQTMSAFFVHDLKNAASSLTLMLQNLPVHFDDPAFRADALRGIGRTVERINHLISRLGVLRNKLELKPVECDLNQLVLEVLQNAPAPPEVRWVEKLQPLPPIMADREQLQNVVTNLLLNAGEAVSRGGEVIVQTTQRDGRAIFSVTDNGCGMSAAFLRDSLFRPFHTTKKKGLGIGMFQSKMIVDAHHGDIEVESEPGKGTTFRVILPVRSNAS